MNIVLDTQEIEASLEQFRMVRGRRQLGNRLQDILARYMRLHIILKVIILVVISILNLMCQSCLQR